MRSFSNLWYWIMLAVAWSSASHWVLGVPYDLIQRAERRGGPVEQDLHEMVRINVGRILYISEVSGLLLLGLACFVLTVLAVLGFVYRIEFCQAVFLVAFPMSFVGLLSVVTARRIRARALAGKQLYHRLTLHRRLTQLIGMFSILVTAMWGMYQNLAIGPLGS